jgi:hypothetical protein
LCKKVGKKQKKSEQWDGKFDLSGEENSAQNSVEPAVVFLRSAPQRAQFLAHPRKVETRSSIKSKVIYDLKATIAFFCSHKK